MRRRAIAMGVILSVVALVLSGLAVAQPGGGQAGQAGQRGQRGQRGMDREQMQQMMQERMRETFGATEQEWQVLGPRVMKVSELTQQLSSGGRGGMFGMRARGGRRGAEEGAAGGERGQRGGPGGMAGAGGEQSAYQQAMMALQELLDDSSAETDAIKTALLKVRSEKVKLRNELAAAQKDLQEVLSVPQEARAVLMGLLD